jgi:murein DD-endopeptidase MepM/ murein hydrolase activator NlpD
MTPEHTTRRAALEAERAARRPARRSIVPRAERQPTRQPTRQAARQQARRTPVPTGPKPTSPRPITPATATSATTPRRRIGQMATTGALAAFVLFASSAMPAHAGTTSSVATSGIAPSVRGQSYAVTTAVAAAASTRDGFTVSERAAASAGSAVTVGEGEVRSPFPGPVRMSSGFGYRSAPCNGCSSMHQGLDFNPGMGAPIGAVAAGTVRVSGTYFSYGTAVIIDHEIDGRKVSTLYGHMIPGSSPLRVGQRVAAGEFIGKVGNSGISTGAHLHLEVLMDGTLPVDPAAWIESHTGRPL